MRSRGGTYLVLRRYLDEFLTSLFPENGSLSSHVFLSIASWGRSESLYSSIQKNSKLHDKSHCFQTYFTNGTTFSC